MAAQSECLGLNCPGIIELRRAMLRRCDDDHNLLELQSIMNDCDKSRNEIGAHACILYFAKSEVPNA